MRSLIVESFDNSFEWRCELNYGRIMVLFLSEISHYCSAFCFLISWSNSVSIFVNSARVIKSLDLNVPSL